MGGNSPEVGVRLDAWSEGAWRAVGRSRVEGMGGCKEWMGT